MSIHFYIAGGLIYLGIVIGTAPVLWRVMFEDRERISLEDLSLYLFLVLTVIVPAFLLACKIKIKNPFYKKDKP